MYSDCIINNDSQGVTLGKSDGFEPSARPLPRPFGWLGLEFNQGNLISSDCQ